MMNTRRIARVVVGAMTGCVCLGGNAHSDAAKNLLFLADSQPPTAAPTPSQHPYNNKNATQTPTQAPHANSPNTPHAPTPAKNHTGNTTTAAPAISPTSPHNDTNTTTAAPSLSPHQASNTTSAAPSLSPHKASNTTSAAPSLAPHKAPNTTTPAPAPHPAVTNAPSKHPATPVPSPDNSNQKKHPSFLRIIGKTIAWLILIFLSVIAFGAVMSHRYRIYFFLRGCWYTFWRLDCTIWILTKLRWRNSNTRSPPTSTILFDNELSEGLLMRESSD